MGFCLIQINDWLIDWLIDWIVNRGLIITIKRFRNKIKSLLTKKELQKIGNCAQINSKYRPNTLRKTILTNSFPLLHILWKYIICVIQIVCRVIQAIIKCTGSAQPSRLTGLWFKPSYLPLEVFFPRNLGLKSQCNWKRVATGNIRQFGRPLRRIHEVRVSSIIDESTSIWHGSHQTIWINVSTTIILHYTEFTVNAWILVGLVNCRIATFFVALWHYAAAARCQHAWVILLSKQRTVAIVKFLGNSSKLFLP